MATVPDLAGISPATDKSLVKHNRTNAGTPGGTVTPLFSGEIILDTTGGGLYQAQGMTNNSWIFFSRGAFLT